jgi:hypothetical protein
MAEVKLNYVHAYKAKGRTYYYFRKKGFPKARLPDPSSPDFSAEYDRLLRQAGADTGPRRAKANSLGELIATFRGSPEYLDEIKPKTRKAYDRYLAMLADVDDLPADAMSRQWVLHRRDQLSDKPRTANYFMQTVRRLYSFGMDRGMVSHNPALKRASHGHDQDGPRVQGRSLPPRVPQGARCSGIAPPSIPRPAAHDGPEIGGSRRRREVYPRA